MCHLALDEVKAQRHSAQPAVRLIYRENIAASSGSAVFIAGFRTSALMPRTSNHTNHKLQVTRVHALYIISCFPLNRILWHSYLHTLFAIIVRCITGYIQYGYILRSYFFTVRVAYILCVYGTTVTVTSYSMSYVAVCVATRWIVRRDIEEFS